MNAPSNDLAWDADSERIIAAGDGREKYVYAPRRLVPPFFVHLLFPCFCGVTLKIRTRLFAQHGRFDGRDHRAFQGLLFVRLWAGLECVCLFLSE